MITVERLQAYLRHIARQQYEVANVAPFTLFFHPANLATNFNYAIPDEPVGGDLRAPLQELRAAFAARGRLARLEFLEDFAPELAPALRGAGFVEESRLQVMVCTRETYRPVPEVPDLEIVTLSAGSSLADIREGLDTNERGFDPSYMGTASDDEAERFRRGLVHNHAFTARLGGRPVAAGMYNPPFDGLTELVGITTLEPFRRRGIAAALTAHAVRTAFDHGAEAALLTAADARAGHVYERVGFQAWSIMLAYRET